MAIRAITASCRNGTRPMLDVIFLVSAVALFAVMAAYVAACDRL
ncbi:MAG TPA: hypothetical protein VH414_02030 [Lichenihabitans sp.]|jgi:hypothetical protein|nr:hypothetical protein [Lichenihabitans sp.]